MASTRPSSRRPQVWIESPSCSSYNATVMNPASPQETGELMSSDDNNNETAATLDATTSKVGKSNSVDNDSDQEVDNHETSAADDEKVKTIDHQHSSTNATSETKVSSVSENADSSLEEKRTKQDDKEKHTGHDHANSIDGSEAERDDKESSEQELGKETLDAEKSPSTVDVSTSEEDVENSDVKELGQREEKLVGDDNEKLLNDCKPSEEAVDKTVEERAEPIHNEQQHDGDDGEETLPDDVAQPALKEHDHCDNSMQQVETHDERNETTQDTVDLTSPNHGENSDRERETSKKTLDIRNDGTGDNVPDTGTQNENDAREEKNDGDVEMLQDTTKPSTLEESDEDHDDDMRGGASEQLNNEKLQEEDKLEVGNEEDPMKEQPGGEGLHETLSDRKEDGKIAGKEKVIEDTSPEKEDDEDNQQEDDNDGGDQGSEVAKQLENGSQKRPLPEESDSESSSSESENSHKKKPRVEADSESEGDENSVGRVSPASEAEVADNVMSNNEEDDENVPRRRVTRLQKRSSFQYIHKELHPDALKRNVQHATAAAKKPAATRRGRPKGNTNTSGSAEEQESRISSENIPESNPSPPNVAGQANDSNVEWNRLLRPENDDEPDQPKRRRLRPVYERTCKTEAQNNSKETPPRPRRLALRQYATEQQQKPPSDTGRNQLAISSLVQETVSVTTSNINSSGRTSHQEHKSTVTAYSLFLQEHSSSQKRGTKASVEWTKLSPRKRKYWQQRAEDRLKKRNDDDTATMDTLVTAAQNESAQNTKRAKRAAVRKEKATNAGQISKASTSKRATTTRKEKSTTVAHTASKSKGRSGPKTSKTNSTITSEKDQSISTSLATSNGSDRVAPKRPPPAFALFQSDHLPAIRAAHPELSHPERQEMLSAEWHDGLTGEERQTYVDRATALKESYEQELEEWQKTNHGGAIATGSKTSPVTTSIKHAGSNKETREKPPPKAKVAGSKVEEVEEEERGQVVPMARKNGNTKESAVKHFPTRRPPGRPPQGFEWSAKMGRYVETHTSETRGQGTSRTRKPSPAASARATAAASASSSQGLNRKEASKSRDRAVEIGRKKHALQQQEQRSAQQEGPQEQPAPQLGEQDEAANQQEEQKQPARQREERSQSAQQRRMNNSNDLFDNLARGNVNGLTKLMGQETNNFGNVSHRVSSTTERATVARNTHNNALTSRNNPNSSPSEGSKVAHFELQAYRDKRVGEDGSIVPAQSLQRAADMTFQRPLGPTPSRYDWDSIRGLWVPVSPPSDRPAQPAFVPCGNCDSCLVHQDCGRCLSCMNSMGDCRLRICRAPVGARSESS